MTIALNSRARGILGVRADAGNLPTIIAEMQQTFQAFKDERDKELADIKKGLADCVQTEKVERINAEIGTLTTAINDAKAALDALRVGGGGSQPIDADVRAHSDAFNRWFRRGGDPEALKQLQMKAKLTTQSDPDGGFLVPTEMEGTVDRVLATVSAMRGLARVVQVSSDEYSKLVNLGGTTSGWVGEEEARASTSTPTLSKITIAAGEIYAEPVTTQRMLDDGIVDVAAWLADEVSVEFAEEEGLAFISGNGVNKPRGILAYDTVANASYAWGKLGFTVTGAAAAFATSKPADAIIDLFYSLKAGYRNGASFLTSDAVLGTIRKFKGSDDNYLWSPPTVDMPATILGKPVETDDNMSALGANAFPVAFGNFQRGYLITDRKGITVIRDDITSKGNVKFYTTKRVGGGVVNFEAIKLLKCST